MATHRFTLLVLVLVIGTFTSSSQVFSLSSRILNPNFLGTQIGKRPVSSFLPGISVQILATSQINFRIKSFSLPFATKLATLQTQIGYNFTNINLLRRAMTHASFSQENNKALSVFGTHIIETSVSLHFITKDIDISSKALNHYITQVLNVDSSCALDGNRLGLDKIIRVSPKTDASNSAILCSGFRAIFGAIAIDAGMVDEAIKVFWKVHGDVVGKLVSVS